MKPKTRQTLIGVTGMTMVALMALHEGINGRVMAMFFVAVIALIAPEALDRIPPWSKT